MIVLKTLAFEAPKTEKTIKVLKAFDAKKVLIITGESSEVLYKSARNITDVQTTPVNNTSVHDLLKFEKLIIAKDAVSRVEEVYAQ